MKEVNTSKLRRTSLRADPMRLLTMLAGFDLMPGALTPTACTEEQKKTGQTQAHSESPEAIMSLTRCSNQYVAAFGDSKLDLKEFIDQAFIPN